MSIISVLLLISLVSAETEFFGPYEEKTHTYKHVDYVDNTFISYNYALVVLIAPLVVLLISLIFRSNLKGLLSGKGLISLVFVVAAGFFALFIVYSWIHFSFFQTLAYTACIAPVLLILAKLSA